MTPKLRGQDIAKEAQAPEDRMKRFAKPPFDEPPMIDGKDHEILIEPDFSPVLLNPPCQFRVFITGEHRIESTGGVNGFPFYDHV